MPITINGTTGIIGGAGTPILQQTGSVLQVVTATTSTNTSTTSTTYVDSGLSATITPTSATSKIAVLVTQSTFASITATTVIGGIRLLRDSTVLISPPADATTGIPYGIGIKATGATAVYVYTTFAVNYIDSPATTSAVTYKTQQAAYNTSTTFQTQPSGGATNPTSTIILMEIAG